MSIGQVDMGGVVDRENDGVLANKLLSFQLLGLSTAINVHVAYFLVNNLTAEELTKLTTYVIKEVEQATEVKIICLVTDNLSINVKMFSLLNNGEQPVCRVPHPVDSTRPLFLSYDYCHIMKNRRNQLLD